MTTVIRALGIDWSDKGFDRLTPFVAPSAVTYFYDFAAGANQMKDRSGNKGNALAYRHDIKDGPTYTLDPTVMVGIDDGAGIRVELGHLLLDDVVASIPIDGSVTFTVMIAGGYSGVVFPAGKVVGSAAAICSLFDYGTGLSSIGYDIETAASTNASRIKSGAASFSSTPRNSKGVIFLTYNGTAWTYYDKTNNVTLTKTNAELGIVAPIPAGLYVSKVNVGNIHPSSTLGALYPNIYQVGKWNRVLTTDEINEQYALTKTRKPTVV